MHRSVLSTVVLAAALCFLGGCAAPVSEPEQTGFLSDYSNLELVKEGNIIYVGDRLDQYESFIIDPIAILFRQDPEDQEFTDEDLEELKAYFHAELTEQLTRNDGFALVTEPGPGVARMRIGITEVEETIGVLNLSIYTKVTGLGLGGASAEGELIDSVSGEQIAAMVRWGTGSRFLQAGLTKMGDAKIAINKWTRDLRKLLDQVHGR